MCAHRPGLSISSHVVDKLPGRQLEFPSNPAFSSIPRGKAPGISVFARLQGVDVLEVGVQAPDFELPAVTGDRPSSSPASTLIRVGDLMSIDPPLGFGEERARAPAANSIAAR